ENVARIEHEKKVAAAKSAKAKAEAEGLAQKLGAVKLTLERPVGEGDRLYGAVTSRDIEEALAAQGYAVDRRRIAVEPIKALGTHQVVIRLGTAISATVEVSVVKKG